MKRDLSEELYKKYFRLNDRKVEITLKNNVVLKGILVGFFRGDEDAEEPCIERWHLADEKNEFSLGLDAFGFLSGTIVKQKDIAEILFFEDNSVMKF